jgi:hypothetical protein
MSKVFFEFKLTGNFIVFLEANPKLKVFNNKILSVNIN